MKTSDIVFTLLSYLLFILFGIVVVPIGLLFFLIPKRWLYEFKPYYWFLQGVYWLMLQCTFLSITYVGRKNVPREPAIIVANHQSSLDIPLVGLLMHGYPHIWLAWSELFRPFFHRLILSRLAVSIDVTSAHTAMRSLINSISIIRDRKMSAIIFPEGSRFTDGKVHDFYLGFVMLAKKTGRPVVPVCIKNAYKVYPPHTFFVQWYPIQVIVGQPMMMQENETDEMFKDRVHAWFTEQTER